MARERRIVAEFDASTTRFDRSMSGMDGRLARFETDATRRLRNIEDRFARFDQRMATSARAIGAVIAGAIGREAIVAAGDFEATLIRVKDAAGATAAEMKKLEAAARAMGRSGLGVSAREAAEGMEILAKNGVSAKDILGGALQATATLSRAMGVEMSRAADLATDAMAIFGAKASDLPKIADQIAGAGVASKFTFEDLRQALANAGGVAKLVGMDFRDLNAGIASTAAMFASGADAGTSFKTFVMNLSPTSKEAQREIERLGFEFFDAQGKVKPLTEVAEELRKGLAGLSEQSKVMSLKTIFGDDAIRTAAALAEQGAAGVEKFHQTIGRVSAVDHATNRMKGYEGAVKNLKASWEDFLLTAAQSGPLDLATSAVRGVTEAVGYLSKNFQDIWPWAEKLAAVLAVIGATRGITAVMSAVRSARDARVEAVTQAQIGLTSANVDRAGAVSRVDKAEARFNAAAGGVGRAWNGSEAAQAKAAREMATARKEYAAALGGETAALARVRAATDSVTAAQARMSLSTRVAQGAMAGLNGVMSFFGGPIGLAITAVGLGVAYLATRSDSAADAMGRLDSAVSGAERALSEAERISGDLEQAKADLVEASKRLSEAVATEGDVARATANQEIAAIESRIRKHKELHAVVLREAQLKAIEARQAAAQVRDEAVRHGRQQMVLEAMGTPLPQWVDPQDEWRYREEQAASIAATASEDILQRMGAAANTASQAIATALREGGDANLTAAELAASRAYDAAMIATAKADDAARLATEAEALINGVTVPAASPPAPSGGGGSRPAAVVLPSLSSEVADLLDRSGAASIRIAELRGHIDKLRAALDTAPEGEKPKILAAITAFEEQITGIQKRGAQTTRETRDVIGEATQAHEGRISALKAESDALSDGARAGEIARQVAEQVASEAKEGIKPTEERTKALYRQKAAEYDLAKAVEQTKAELESAKNLQREMGRETGDAAFELSLVGKPEAQIEALRIVHERLRQIEDVGEGIDLSAPGAMFDGKPIAEWRAEIEATAAEVARLNAERKAAEAELSSDKAYQRRIAEMTAERDALKQAGLGFRALTESAEIAKEAASRHADLKEAGSKRTLAAVLEEVKAEKALAREIAQTLALKQFGHDVDERLKSLADEAAVVGKTGEEAARLRTALELLRKLESEGVEITATLKGDVEEKAARIARAMSDISRRQILVDLGLEAEDAEADAQAETQALGMKGAALDALHMKAQALRALEKEGHAATEGELEAITKAVRRYEVAKTAANIATLHFGIGEDADAAIRQIDAAVAALGKTEAEAAGLAFTAAQLEKYRNLGIDADPDALAKIAEGAERIREAAEAQMRATALQAAGKDRTEALVKIAEARAAVGATEAELAGLSYRASEMARWRNLGIKAPPGELAQIEEGVARIRAETEALKRAEAAESGRVSGREALAGIGDSIAQIGQTEAAVARLSFVASEMAKYRNLGIDADPEELRRITERAREIGAATQEAVDARARDSLDKAGEEAWIALEYEIDAINARTDAEKAAAVVKRELLKYQLEGVTITPELVASIQAQADAQVEGAKRLAVAQETAKFSGESYWDTFQSRAFDALQDVRNLEDGLKALAGQLLKMASQDLWKFAFGQQTGGLGGLLFGSQNAGSVSFGGGGGGGGLFSGIGSFISGLFMADGGKVRGPGGPRDDAVPIWGSNGEYMVNARATAKYLPWLDAINFGRPIPALADGGRVGRAPSLQIPRLRAPNIADPGPQSINFAPSYNMNISGGGDPRETATLVQKQLEENNRTMKRELLALVAKTHRNNRGWLVDT